MPEPLTLAVVGGSIITEGIKFLYGQAAEAIKRWREQRDASSISETLPAQISPPAIFEGALAPLEFHLGQLEPLEKHLIKLRRALTDYADGLEPIDLSNRELLETVDALRQAMEAIYQQRLTFKGEPRAGSGPVIEGTIDVNTIAGTAAAVEARLVASGRVVGTVKADKLESGGSAYGVRVDTVGGKNAG